MGSFRGGYGVFLKGITGFVKWDKQGWGYRYWHRIEVDRDIDFTL